MATRRKKTESVDRAAPVRVVALDAGSELHLEGIVGVSQAKYLHQLALQLAGSGGPVEVRCEHLQHLDCAAVQVLLALDRTLKSKGAGIRLQNLPDSVHQTLRNAGLGSAL